MLFKSQNIAQKKVFTYVTYVMIEFIYIGIFVQYIFSLQWPLANATVASVTYEVNTQWVHHGSEGDTQSNENYRSTVLQKYPCVALFMSSLNCIKIEYNFICETKGLFSKSLA